MVPTPTPARRVPGLGVSAGNSNANGNPSATVDNSRLNDTMPKTPFGPTMYNNSPNRDLPVSDYRGFKSPTTIVNQINSTRPFIPSQSATPMNMNHSRQMPNFTSTQTTPMNYGTGQSSNYATPNNFNHMNNNVHTQPPMGTPMGTPMGSSMGSSMGAYPLGMMLGGMSMGMSGMMNNSLFSWLYSINYFLTSIAMLFDVNSPMYMVFCQLYTNVRMSVHRLVTIIRSSAIRRWLQRKSRQSNVFRVIIILISMAIASQSVKLVRLFYHEFVLHQRRRLDRF